MLSRLFLPPCPPQCVVTLYRAAQEKKIGENGVGHRLVEVPIKIQLRSIVFCHVGKFHLTLSSFAFRLFSLLSFFLGGILRCKRYYGACDRLGLENDTTGDESYGEREGGKGRKEEREKRVSVCVCVCVCMM
jgi:hypothetical protein